MYVCVCYEIPTDSYCSNLMQNLNINREMPKHLDSMQESQKELVRRLETLSSENEKLKEDIICLTNRNSDLKKDFLEIKGVNTNLAEDLAAKERLALSMEDEKRRDTLRYDMQEKN